MRMLLLKLKWIMESFGLFSCTENACSLSEDSVFVEQTEDECGAIEA